VPPKRSPLLLLKLLAASLNVVHWALSSAWALVAPTPVGKAVANSYLIQYWLGSCYNVYHVFLQAGGELQARMDSKSAVNGRHNCACRNWTCSTLTMWILWVGA
jgi:hypothetical protein